MSANLNVTFHHDVYPSIDPASHYESQTYAEKVVLITGASRGLGEEAAVQYAKCGASLALIARNRATLEAVKSNILEKVPAAQVGLFAADVTDNYAMKAAIHGIIDTYGHLDVVIANAGRSESWKEPLGAHDPEDFWKTMEVNVKGVYLTAHFTLPFLSVTKGRLVIVSAVSAWLRLPCSAAYTMSKLAINCLGEFLTIENPDVKTFSIHPGGVITELTKDKPESVQAFIQDTPQLSACTMLALTSGEYDWLNGRYYSVNWDLREVTGLKDKIQKDNALVSQLVTV